MSQMVRMRQNCVFFSFFWSLTFKNINRELKKLSIKEKNREKKIDYWLILLMVRQF